MTAAVRISSQLRDALGDLSQRVGEGGFVRLLLEPEGDVAAAEHRLLAAFLEVQEDFLQRGVASGELDPPDTGEWDWSNVPAGLLIIIRESNALEGVLEAVVAALGRHEVSGVLGLWKAAPIRELPFQAPMIACRLRLAGCRLEDRTWRVDDATRNAMVAVAHAWCQKGVPDGSSALFVGTVGPIGLDAVEDMVASIGAEIEEGRQAQVENVGSAAFRVVNVSANGTMVLVSGGAHIETGGWEPELAELTELLRSSADHLAYGCILRGWDLIGALSSFDLPTDWPLRPGTMRQTDRPAPDAEQANDIFGVQLLGPGYPNDLPATANWHTEQVGTARQLLSNTDLSAWFSAPPIPAGQRLPIKERPTPPILSKARDEFAAILSPTPSV